jgi:hypothetical protein
MRPSRPMFGSCAVRISPHDRQMATTMPPKLALVPALGVVIFQSCAWGSGVKVMSAWYGPRRPSRLWPA